MGVVIHSVVEYFKNKSAPLTPSADPHASQELEPVVDPEARLMHRLEDNEAEVESKRETMDNSFSPEETEARYKAGVAAVRKTDEAPVAPSVVSVIASYTKKSKEDTKEEVEDEDEDEPMP